MKLIITGAWAGAKKRTPEIEDKGHEVYFMQQEADKLPIPAGEVEGVIANGLFLHHPISEFTKLHYIQLTSAGFDRVDMNYVREHDIEIHNARGVYSIPIAETVLGALLDYYRGISTFAKNQEVKVWEKRRDLEELCGRSVCIVGCGSVGSEIAKRLRAFGCTVHGIDIKPYENDAYDEMKSLDNAGEIFASSDIVIATVPLTDETRHMFNAESFSLMKDGCVFVNVARGGLVDEAALISAIESGKVAHAALDVFEEEPLEADSPLWSIKEISVMPHNSFVSSGNDSRLWNIIRENLN